jgi:CheY-like chemotaxis protein
MDPSLNVLVAEDDENDAFLLQRAFHAIGMKHPLHIVHDGADAIDYLSGQGAFADRAVHPPANYVIVDLKMPRVDGFGVLEYLQKHGELLVIPTLVWSSSTDVRDVKRAYCLGANGYLQKPSNFEQLREMVETVVRYWSACQVPTVETPPYCEELKDKHPFCGTSGWHG